MSSEDNERIVGRLISQQRRIRHLKSILGRNIQYTNHESQNTQLYFTLHLSDDDEAFYTSEQIKGSINPSWKGFSLDNLCLTDVNTSRTFFVVKVWSSSPGTRDTLCVSWHVHLSGLVYIQNQMQKEVLFPSNTLLFGLFNGFYTAPDIQNSAESCSSITVDQSQCHISYSATTLARVQTVLRAIKQTETSGKKARAVIEEKFLQAKQAQEKACVLEALRMRLSQLQSDLDWRMKKLHNEKQAYENLQTANRQIDRNLQEHFDTLKKDRQRLREKKKKYFDIREDLIKTGAQLVMRRKQLISELAFIYPIREVPNTGFNIANVLLPNATDYHGVNETQLEVSLGYTCHLVHMVSHFLDVPLRYPMEHKGSKSTITDHIVDKLTDKDREFPLYSKGKEKFQFEYGVYLLNKNVAQLRYYCGLGTTDLRLTLSNLKTLLQLRLGVRFDHLDDYSHETVIRYRQYAQSSESSSTKQHSPTISTLSDAPGQPIQHSNSERHENKASPELDERVNSVKVMDKESQGNSKDLIKDQQVNESLSVVTEASIMRPKIADKGTGKRNKLHLDTDVHSLEDAFQTPIHFSPKMHTLDELMNKNMLGPLTSYQDIDVSSSEDSASAVYGSKMWPRILDNLSQDSHINGKRKEPNSVVNHQLEQDSQYKNQLEPNTHSKNQLEPDFQFHKQLPLDSPFKNQLATELRFENQLEPVVQDNPLEQACYNYQYKDLFKSESPKVNGQFDNQFLKQRSLSENSEDFDEIPTFKTDNNAHNCDRLSRQETDSPTFKLV